MKKIKGFIKYYSFIIFPTAIFIISYYVGKQFQFLNLNESKATSLVSAASTFIGVLITILTVYLAVPKNEQKKQQLKKSGHERIYLYNILTGIFILLLSIFVWIFFDYSRLLSLLFLSGLSNIIISIYYTFALIKLM